MKNQMQKKQNYFAIFIFRDDVSLNHNELASLTAAHKAMKSLKDLIPCEFTRDDITQSADELINSLNAKRKQDTELLADFKRTSELQVYLNTKMKQDTCTGKY